MNTTTDDLAAGSPAPATANSPLISAEEIQIEESLHNSTTVPSTSLPADLGVAPNHHGSIPGGHDPASYYWDVATMAPLNSRSAAAIVRLRAYKPPPFPTWDRLPLSRRAAVLILLFADRRGDLRVVITMRAASLRSFSGHAAFPGGKADSLQETPYQIARREAWEEIGLPLDDGKMPPPFRLEHLCHLPCSLAKTELAVRPCVAFIHADDLPGREPTPTVDESMMPRLDAKEVAAVFSGPFHNFLKAHDEGVEDGEAEDEDGGRALPAGEWYDGRWLHFQDEPWRVHNFHVPVANQRVTRPRAREGGLSALAEQLEEDEREGSSVQRFLVWGMTGRMLVDCARIAYGEEPEFPHNEHYGDEALIRRMEEAGRMPEKEGAGGRKDVGLGATREDVKDAKI